MDELGILAALGWTVVEVPQMRDAACLVHSQRVALVSSDLDSAQRVEVAGALLTRALDHDSPGHPAR